MQNTLPDKQDWKNSLLADLPWTSGSKEMIPDGNLNPYKEKGALVKVIT